MENNTTPHTSDTPEQDTVGTLSHDPGRSDVQPAEVESVEVQAAEVKPEAEQPAVEEMTEELLTEKITDIQRSKKPHPIPYNSELKPLKLPEYGRNIQKLLDECLKIEDREERTQCAYAIVNVISNLLQDHVSENGNTKKIWDHLMIMSDFQLDVDFPYEVISKEKLTPDASPIPYYGNTTISRQYGRLIKSMIDVVSDMPGGEEKDMLILLIANQMKKLLLTYNSNGVTDERVINDLNTMSNGRIAIDPANYKLQDYKGVNKDSRIESQKKKRKVKTMTHKKRNQF